MYLSMRKSTKLDSPPAGFLYQEDIVPPDEETDLVRQIEKLPLKEFEFHGYTGKRRVISFGWRYDFAEYGLREVGTIPEFLFSLRKRASAFTGIEPEDLGHALITEYKPGTTIGWHRDKGVFGDVVGISLVSPCTFRFRRKTEDGWLRHSLKLAPRSAYLLRGESREMWEHSIPAVESLRYSITFRTLRNVFRKRD